MYIETNPGRHPQLSTLNIFHQELPMSGGRIDAILLTLDGKDGFIGPGEILLIDKLSSTIV